jgi:acetyl-CoA acetyltransferase
MRSSTPPSTSKRWTRWANQRQESSYRLRPASAYGEAAEVDVHGLYGASAWRHMEAHGTTQLQLMIISPRTTFASEPYAQYRRCPGRGPLDVVASLTRPMCAPLGDGAAAAVLCSGRS